MARNRERKGRKWNGRTGGGEACAVTGLGTQRMDLSQVSLMGCDAYAYLRRILGKGSRPRCNMQRNGATYNATVQHATQRCNMQRNGATYNAAVQHATQRCGLGSFQHASDNMQHT